MPLDEFSIMVFKGLSVNELEELWNEIKMHADLDRAMPTRIRYLEALMVVCEWELAEAREMIGEERGLHMSIETDVKNVLQGKAYDELEALQSKIESQMQSKIESQMQSGAAKVVEFWEAVYKRLDIFKAKACLNEMHHAKMMKVTKDESSNKIEFSTALELSNKIDLAQDEDEEAGAGSYSPKLMVHDDDEPEDAIIEPEEDKAMLERRRIAVLEKQNDFEKNALEAMEEGDAVFGFSDEINLDSNQVYRWHGKYRPRKPKYYNRVHTGHEWNKYNQTHYDHDNPPPKNCTGV